MLGVAALLWRLLSDMHFTRESGPTLRVSRAAGSVVERDEWWHAKAAKVAPSPGPRQRRRLHAVVRPPSRVNIVFWLLYAEFSTSGRGHSVCDGSSGAGCSVVVELGSCVGRCFDERVAKGCC